MRDDPKEERRPSDHLKFEIKRKIEMETGS